MVYGELVRGITILMDRMSNAGHHISAGRPFEATWLGNDTIYFKKNDKYILGYTE